MTSSGGAPRWSLTLYVSGASPRSSAALETVRRICDEELAGRVDLRIVDLAEEPIGWRYAGAFACMMGAVGFMFAGRS